MSVAGGLAEDCLPWQWMVHHAEASFFAVESSSPAGTWGSVEFYARDFRYMLCGHPDGGCDAPPPAICWPAHALAVLFLAVGVGGVDALLDGTARALDAVLRQSVGEWNLAIEGRWPIFGVFLRILSRLGSIDHRVECRPSGASLPSARDELRGLAGSHGDALSSASSPLLHDFVQAACPHLEQLDRLVCAPWIAGDSGAIRVFAHREVISDRIRGTGNPSCGLGVDAEIAHAEVEAASRRELPVIVEVGPFLCDCLWLHARRVKRWLAFELNSDAARLCAETIQANGLGASARITVAAVGDGRPVRTATNAREPSWTTSFAAGQDASRALPTARRSDAWVPTVRLDDFLPTLLAPGELVDLLLLHTNGFEHTVLEGAEGFLWSGRVRAVMGPLIGDEDWTLMLPRNFSLQNRMQSGAGTSLQQKAAAARWTGS